jgi:hypothetical protein
MCGASVSISRSWALVFGGSRLKGFCHWVMDNIWDAAGGIKPLLVLPSRPRLRNTGHGSGDAPRLLTGITK